MSHLSGLEKPYRQLIKRLNKYQVGAPDTEEIFRILQLLYTREEALVGSRFPLGPATLRELSAKTGIEAPRLQKILEKMARKGIVMDYRPGDTRFFVLTPTIFGFFEFSFMRLNSELPLKELSALMESALEKEMGQEFFGSRTQMSRALIYEKHIPRSRVMPYEQASELIRNSSRLSLQVCYCRHKAQHLGKPCRTPMEMCMGLGFTAEFLIRRGLARQAAAGEMTELLDKAEELGLVHITDNVRDDPLFICNCCTCCCELLRGPNRLNIIGSVTPSRFISKADARKCTACGACAARCPVGAIRVHREEGGPGEKIIVEKARCLGCAVCISCCKKSALEMVVRPGSYRVPKNQLTRHIKIAAEKGRLRHFLFYAAGKLLRGGDIMMGQDFK